MEVVSFDDKSITVDIEFRARLQSRGKSDLPTVLYYFEGERGFYGVDNLDADWKNIATNNVTLWIWSLHKQHTTSWTLRPHLWAGLWYPCETFTMRLWIATNSPAFNLTTTRPSGYGYEFDLRVLQKTTLETMPNEEIRSEFSKSYVPNRYFAELIVEHTFEYKALTFVFVAFTISIGAVFFELFIDLVKKRKRLKGSDFIQVCLGALFFIPVFLLTFRTTIAPTYLTWFDFILGSLATLWGIILFVRVKNYNCV